MSAKKLPPEQRSPTSAADAAQRLATIVDAAERAAASVIDDAEKQARRHLDEARDRADRIVAERLRELADELDPPASDGRRVGHLKPVEVDPEPVEISESSDPEEVDAAELVDRAEEPPPLQRRSGSAGARLLATQMAVSGAGREEIEERLRNGFEIEDTGEILDAILGPED